MIYARSPYIVYDDTASLVSVRFRLRIYEGNSTTDSTTGEEYIFDVPAINGAVEFDISPYIKDYLRSIATSPGGANRFVWVRQEIDRDTGAGLSGSYTLFEGTQLACDGYSTDRQGVNYTTYPADFLLDFTEQRIIKGQTSSIIVPFRTYGLYLGLHEYRVQSFPQLNGGGTLISSVTITSSSTSESDGNLVYVQIPATAKSVVWKDDSDNFVITRNVYSIQDCQNEVTRMFFINKLGVREEVQFFGRRIDEFSTEDKSYRKSILSGGTYNLHNRQQTSYNKSGKRRMTVSTGFYPEWYNIRFTQLLMSREIWFLEETATPTAQDAYSPVTLVDSDLRYKYSRYEKLISYDMTFEFANDYINSIK